jgi:hypothetical protein
MDEMTADFEPTNSRTADETPEASAQKLKEKLNKVKV